MFRGWTKTKKFENGKKRDRKLYESAWVKESVREREIKIQTERLKERQINRQTERQKDRQINRKRQKEGEGRE